jgi:hypothetical protein
LEELKRGGIYELLLPCWHTKIDNFGVFSHAGLIEGNFLVYAQLKYGFETGLGLYVRPSSISWQDSWN